VGITNGAAAFGRTPVDWARTNWAKPKTTAAQKRRPRCMPALRNRVPGLRLLSVQARELNTFLVVDADVNPVRSTRSPSREVVEMCADCGAIVTPRRGIGNIGSRRG
jgi:hypothetical protein